MQLLVAYNTISLHIGIIGMAISHLCDMSNIVRVLWIGHLIIAMTSFMTGRVML